MGAAREPLQDGGDKEGARKEQGPQPEPTLPFQRNQDRPDATAATEASGRARDRRGEGEGRARDRHEQPRCAVPTCVAGSMLL